jgi:hypothetical protein
MAQQLYEKSGETVRNVRERIGRRAPSEEVAPEEA